LFDTEKDTKIESYKQKYDKGIVDKKELVVENISITKNRPFHCFEVDQVSYMDQYKTYSMNLSQLNLLAVLGKGAFGKVFISKIDTDWYAVKMLGKKQIIADKMVENVKLEIKTMRDLKHPHLLSISYVSNES
jgi:serine/threonine protein kinase